MLLKRPGFNVDSIINAAPTKQDKNKIQNWRDAKSILIYDADSRQPSASPPIVALAEKFHSTDPHWNGSYYCIPGGLEQVKKYAPEVLCNDPVDFGESDIVEGISVSLAVQNRPGIPILLPDKSDDPAIFSNIRQNMADGLSTPIPMKVPSHISSETLKRVPAWMKAIAFDENGALSIRDKFLQIEKEELERLKGAMTSGKEMKGAHCDNPFSIAAAIERGEKNRYNNIWPYEHSRVKLAPTLESPNGYINASFIESKIFPHRFIVSQAPTKNSIEDFWRMVWEQKICTIFMLTALVEGMDAKGDKYWGNECFGNFKVSIVNEQDVVVSVRTLKITNMSLSRLDRPFEPIREIKHIWSSEWRDLQVLGKDDPMESVKFALTVQNLKKDSSPLLVHCSAGCGRSGVLCTLINVMSFIRQNLPKDEAEAKAQKDDMIFNAVQEMRLQRMSLVQTLPQFLRCYESVLAYIVYLLDNKPNPV